MVTGSDKVCPILKSQQFNAAAQAYTGNIDNVLNECYPEPDVIYSEQEVHKHDNTQN